MYKSFALFSQRSLRSANHGNLLSRFFTKVDNFVKRERENPQMDYLKLAIEKKADWKTVRNNILSKEGIITEKNIDAIILKFIIGQRNFDTAYSFANYLQTSGNELNIGTTNSLLQMYIEYSKINQPSDEVRKFILATYKRLYDKYKVLDYFTSEKLLQALCLINEWKLSLKILDDIHLSSTPSHSAYSVVIGTLFRNNNKTEALKLIQRSLNDRRPLQDYAYDEWLKYVLREYKDEKTKVENLEEVCYHLSRNYIKVSEETAERISESFTSLNWSAEYTSVKQHSGQCCVCHRVLDDIEFSDEEFSQLQQNVKSKLIVGSDSFLKTSPEELQRFMNFIEKTKPYDVVLDGLNIAYTNGIAHNREKLNALNGVVDYFARQNKKILLLGRKHMLKWHQPTLKELCRKTCNFFTENLSQDDPYFITAAILSGPQTDIVSRDLLRGHRFLMKQEQLRLLFQRWQWKHQWMIIPHRKRPMLRAPLKFTPSAQRHEAGWHIPYEKAVDSADTEDNNYNDGNADYSTWLCIRKKVDS